MIWCDIISQIDFLSVLSTQSILRPSSQDLRVSLGRKFDDDNATYVLQNIYH
jgi:hypothetical protein